MSTRSREDGRHPRDSSRKAILTAAFELVGEVGYAKLTMDAIAVRAKVGKQTIYRWWPSKGAVLLESFLMLTEGDMENPTPLPDTGDLEADLKEILYATVLEFNDPAYDVPLRALTIAILQDEALAEIYHERLERPIRELKRERLISAQAAGEISPHVDLDAAVDAVFSPIAQRWLLRSGPLTDDYVDEVVRVVVHGLRND